MYILGALISTLKALAEKVKWYIVLPTYPILHAAYGSGFITGMFRWCGYFLNKSNGESD